MASWPRRAYLIESVGSRTIQGKGRWNAGQEPRWSCLKQNRPAPSPLRLAADPARTIRALAHGAWRAIVVVADTWPQIPPRDAAWRKHRCGFPNSPGGRGTQAMPQESRDPAFSARQLPSLPEIARISEQRPPCTLRIASKYKVPLRPLSLAWAAWAGTEYPPHTTFFCRRPTGHAPPGAQIPGDWFSAHLALSKTKGKVKTMSQTINSRTPGCAKSLQGEIYAPRGAAVSRGRRRKSLAATAGGGGGVRQNARKLLANRPNSLRDKNGPECDNPEATHMTTDMPMAGTWTRRGGAPPNASPTHAARTDDEATMCPSPDH